MNGPIYWIVSDENKALRVIWVDDSFFPPSEATSLSSELNTRHNIPDIGCDWLDGFLDSYSAENPDSLPDTLPSQAGWLLAIKNTCEEKNVGFGVTSFNYCREFIQKFNTEETLFLIDIQNIYAENFELYGYEFVQETQLPRERLRYYTRYPSNISRARQLYFRNLSQEDYLNPDTDTEKLKQWIDQQLIHYDPYVCRAIEFYSKPWIENWGYEWEHDEIEDLEKKCLSEFQEYSERLNLSFEDLSVDNSESVKSLLMWCGKEDPWAEWDVAYPHQNSRQLQIKVLKAVFTRLSLPLVSYIADDKWIRVPCEPFLPFLVSLRCLYAHMERQDRPPEQITLDKISSSSGGFDVYMLTLELKDNGSNDPWGLADRFHGTKLEGQNTTTRHLRALVSCRVLDLSPAIDIDNKGYLRCFKDGTKRPVVSIYFAPFRVHVVWTAITVD